MLEYKTNYADLKSSFDQQMAELVQKHEQQLLEKQNEHQQQIQRIQQGRPANKLKSRLQ